MVLVVLFVVYGENKRLFELLFALLICRILEDDKVFIVVIDDFLLLLVVDEGEGDDFVLVGDELIDLILILFIDDLLSSFELFIRLEDVVDEREDKDDDCCLLVVVVAAVVFYLWFVMIIWYKVGFKRKN